MPTPQLIQKQREDRMTRVGRFSDGSDAHDVVTSVWVVRASDPSGALATLEFSHDPTDQEIVDALPQSARLLIPTKKADLERYVEDLYRDWSRWRATQVEATRRGLSAQIITALTNKENAAWDEYLQALNAWRTAS